MDILIHARKADESGATVSNRADDASHSRVPAVDLRRYHGGHGEARGGVTRRERHEWSILIMEAAEKLKVVRVIHVHVRECSPENPLAQAGKACRKKNPLRHVKPGVSQPRQSRQATGRKKACAKDKRPWPAEECELTSGVLQIVTGLELLLLQFSGGPAVEGREGYGCQQGECACHPITLRDPRSRGGHAIAPQILRACGGRNDSRA